MGVGGRWMIGWWVRVRVLADGDWPGLLYALDAVPEQMVVPGGLDPVVLLDWLRRTPGSGVVVRVDPLGDERPDVYFMWRRGSELVLQVPERRDRDAVDVPFGRDVSVSVLRSNALMAPLWWATTLVMVFDGRGVAVTVSALPGQGAAVDGPGQSGRVWDVRIDALPDSLVRRPGATPRAMRPSSGGAGLLGGAIGAIAGPAGRTGELGVWSLSGGRLIPVDVIPDHLPTVQVDADGYVPGFGRPLLGPDYLKSGSACGTTAASWCSWIWTAG